MRDLQSTVKRLCAHGIMWEQIHEVQGNVERRIIALIVYEVSIITSGASRLFTGTFFLFSVPSLTVHEGKSDWEGVELMFPVATGGKVGKPLEESSNCIYRSKINSMNNL